MELQKWRPSEARPLAAQDRWVYFLREARGWYELPGDLDSPEMRKAMSVIERWSQRETDYRAYRARQDEIRVQRIMEKEQRRLEAEQQRLESENVAVKARLQQADAEKARLADENQALRARLAMLDCDPRAG